MKDSSCPSAHQGRKFDYTRNLMIDCAAKLFNQKGYHRTTIREISTCVGLNNSTIYHYLDSKEELLFEVCNRVIHHTLELAEDTVNTSKSSEEKVKEFIKSHLLAALSCKDSISVFIKEHKNLSKDSISDILLVRNRYEKLIESMIANGIRKGEFKDINPRSAALCILAMCSLVIYWSEDGALAIDDIANTFSEIFVNGIASEPRHIINQSGKIYHINPFNCLEEESLEMEY